MFWWILRRRIYGNLMFCIARLIFGYSKSDYVVVFGETSGYLYTLQSWKGTVGGTCAWLLLLLHPALESKTMHNGHQVRLYYIQNDSYLHKQVLPSNLWTNWWPPQVKRSQLKQVSVSWNLLSWSQSIIEEEHRSMREG